MIEDFLKRLFGQKTLYEDIDVAFLIKFSDISIALLFLYYQAINTKQNQILLPKEFLNPELKVYTIRQRQKFKLNDFINLLSTLGYERTDRIYDPMQFILRGDVLTISTNLNDLCYQISFYDNYIDEIHLIDQNTFRTIKQVDNFVLININPIELSFSPYIVGNFSSYSSKPFILNDEFINHFEKPEYIPNFEYLPLFIKNEKLINSFIDDHLDYKFFYYSDLYPNLPDILLNNEYDVEINKIDLPFVIANGFIEDDSKTILFTDYELFGSIILEKYKKPKRSRFSKFFETKVNINDYVVHEAFGIGIYKGIEKKTVLGETKDFIILEYKDGDLLLVPFTQAHRLSKYVSVEGYVPKLTKLGTPEWEVVRKKLKKNVEELTKELLEIYAKKNLEKGIEFEPDNKIQLEFENSCEFELTEDQIKTLNEVKADMESPKPMDRLIIGDVGFGKTEIALRAALKAVLSGKQVLVIAPTTILATQLYNVFISRFKKANLPIVVDRVTRLDGVKHNKEVLKRTKDCKNNIIIGTHRLLSKDVVVPNLGLLIIDEEQRFGVKQKEKIRKLRPNIDVLSMSATPIPRTLHMALTGIKDISIIATPPKNRLPVITEIIFDYEIYEKINFEINRGGQVFVVHNHIEDIDNFVFKLKENLNTSAKICVAHGQMKPNHLEKVMLSFLNKDFNVLVATTIIENGLDIPTVNTIIINKAWELGLSQLYQLRGRVGRSNIQGFCYLVVPKTKKFIELHKNPPQNIRDLYNILETENIDDNWISDNSVDRIKTIITNQELGAGFKIATRDLEIRGSGNLLGSEQSGHINAVGYELYIRLLELEIEKIKKQISHLN